MSYEVFLLRQFLFKYFPNLTIRRCVLVDETNFLSFCPYQACGGNFGPKRTSKKDIEYDYY